MFVVGKKIGIIHLLALCFITSVAYGQTTVLDSSNASSVIVIAGKKYAKGALHNTLWGEHYRKEWAAPVTIKKIRLDTVFGGLTPVKAGGSRQSKNLRLKDKEGKEYVIRSVDKTFTRALSDVYAGTFIESIANDQVSFVHPYAALTIPPLAEAAGVYHTNPQIVYIGNDAALDTFSTEYANQLYLLEERPADAKSNGSNFGYASDIDGTETLMTKLYEDNSHRVDQEAFVRARLFDMFINDWGRHEDQWRWAKKEVGGMHYYTPIPRDRDQAYSKFDGLLVGIGTKLANLPYLQSFAYDIKNIEGYNFQARFLDRQLANEPSKETWMNIAREMQGSLSDSIITHAIHQLPPEVFSISGQEMIDKLKSRRDHLTDFAAHYYQLLAKNVDVVGTKKDELIKLTGMDNDAVKISLYDLDKNGNPKSQPFYSRTFLADETREIRIYGYGGNDRFETEGSTTKKIEIRLIGGSDTDSYHIPRSFNGKIKLYDNRDNSFDVQNVKMKLDNDSSVHSFDYKAYKADDIGIKPKIGYSNEDRIYIGIGYRIEKQQWRKEPFGYSHEISVKYSITQKSFSAAYEGIYNKAIGNWNMKLQAEYDGVRDAHFPGIGNNTVISSPVTNYYRYRNSEFNSSLGLFRILNDKHTITVSGVYQMVKLLQDTGMYIVKNYSPGISGAFAAHHFAGGRLEYNYLNINHPLFPDKGLRFNTAIEYNQNLNQPRSVTNISGLFGFILPVGPFALAIKTGAATLWGEPEFYQLNKLGGGTTLRGFLRYRFYGKTAVYNQNELQWNFNIKTYLFSGKMGLLALFDNGRVWMPGEQSNKWHTAVGGGLMLAPFNQLAVTATCAASDEDLRFNIRLGHFLRR